jgi:hypothetical protein
LSCALRADDPKDVIEVVRENRHFDVAQCGEDGITESCFTELLADLGMKQDVNSRDNSQVREVRRTKPRAFSFVDDSDSPALDGVSNRRCLAVIEGLWTGAGDERLEVKPASIAETDQFDVPGVDKLLQAIGVGTTPLPAGIEFSRYDVNHYNRVWYSPDDGRPAAGCNEIDHGGAVRDQRDERIS